MSNAADTTDITSSTSLTSPPSSIHGQEPPGACSGPLPPASGGNSPARPSSSAVSGEDAEPEQDPAAITVLALALFRGAKPETTGSISMGAIEATGLPFMGGCSVCGATVSAANSCPSRSGYLKCERGCIGDDGFETCEQANLALFPEEYTWNGPATEGGEVQS